ncbi:hypothetical protein CC2G_008026 [Coprinopsis cinerea AmutBmut pab1-1]|nr:hypothetical protein CC2G_008026 [Coprinopsis cinerea AmutBmut pab1-1]
MRDIDICREFCLGCTIDRDPLAEGKRHCRPPVQARSVNPGVLHTLALTTSVGGSMSEANGIETTLLRDEPQEITTRRSNTRPIWDTPLPIRHPPLNGLPKNSASYLTPHNRKSRLRPILLNMSGRRLHDQSVDKQSTRS